VNFDDVMSKPIVLPVGPHRTTVYIIVHTLDDWRLFGHQETENNIVKQLYNLTIF